MGWLVITVHLILVALLVRTQYCSTESDAADLSIDDILEGPDAHKDEADLSIDDILEDSKNPMQRV